MQVTFTLDGPRGRKYRIITQQMGANVGGGILIEIQQWRETRSAHKWVSLASTRETTGDVPARILAAWLTTPQKEPSK